MSVVGVIPARMGASRLPGKPLQPLSGVPMIERVYRRARACPELDQVVVATEDEAIVRFCREKEIPVELTLPHPSGTDRVAELASRIAGDLFVNIQGDQPLLDPRQITALVAVFEGRPDATVGTLAAPLRPDAVESPHTVKVVVAADGRALYFSRAAIPFADGPSALPRWQHVGLYAYRPAALFAFRDGGPSPLERQERLEQLRFLEAGVAIHVGFTDVVTPSVDTPADVALVERVLRETEPKTTDAS